MNASAPDEGMGPPRRARGLARGRHGRGMRSSLAGPYLPRLTGRLLEFERAADDTMAYLRAVVPEVVADVRLEIGSMPPRIEGDDGMDRWHLDGRTIILYRVPIERLEDLHCDDPVHIRALVEATILEALIELTGDAGLDDLAPGRYGE